jgi:hypothetical protein
MPGPFEKPSAPSPDKVVAVLERGSRARQVLQLGVGTDLERRERLIWDTAKRELREGVLTQERAFMHIACANALSRYAKELTDDVTAAQRAADSLHAEPADEPADGDV